MFCWIGIIAFSLFDNNYKHNFRKNSLLQSAASTLYMPKSPPNFQKLCWNRNCWYMIPVNAVCSVPAVIRKGQGFLVFPPLTKNLMQLHQAGSRNTSPENSHVNYWQHSGWTTTDFCTQDGISATSNRIMQLVPVAVPYHDKALRLKLELRASETSLIQLRPALSASCCFDSIYYRTRHSEGIKGYQRKLL